MRVKQAIKALKGSSRQTKFFIFMWALYMLALIWTTVQAYARLEYSRSGTPPKSIIIQTPETK
ncbi:hypothetical protein [Candidatus Protochlamydia phocaeensis]|uniref:hypothetical protein n=1 Tax=Candidatus Protochlamydia phocaeensis TaxID=1414722 RepID=UPI0008389EB4|nr:hypothetical protein [Candidatus Protochlamydia phocaeensis]